VKIETNKLRKGWIEIVGVT